MRVVVVVMVVLGEHSPGTRRNRRPMPPWLVLPSSRIDSEGLVGIILLFSRIPKMASRPSEAKFGTLLLATFNGNLVFLFMAPMTRDLKESGVIPPSFKKGRSKRRRTNNGRISFGSGSRGSRPHEVGCDSEESGHQKAPDGPKWPAP